MGIVPIRGFFLLAGAAEAENDWLDRLVGGLMGIVAALFVGMFGAGFVAMANLSKEIVLQLKKASSDFSIRDPLDSPVFHSRRARAFMKKLECLRREEIGKDIASLLQNIWSVTHVTCNSERPDIPFPLLVEYKDRL
jgi:hypothetical protein